MQKTKLGISVGLLGAAIYFTGLFSGFTVVVLLTGYALLFEENEWLKKNAVKAVILMVLFSLLTAVIGLIPDALDVMNHFFGIFGGDFRLTFLTSLVSAVSSIIDVIRKLLFILLGFEALSQGSVTIPVVDKMIAKYMG